MLPSNVHGGLTRANFTMHQRLWSSTLALGQRIASGRGNKAFGISKRYSRELTSRWIYSPIRASAPVRTCAYETPLSPEHTARVVGRVHALADEARVSRTLVVRRRAPPGAEHRHLLDRRSAS